MIISIKETSHIIAAYSQYISCQAIILVWLLICYYQQNKQMEEHQWPDDDRGLVA